MPYSTDEKVVAAARRFEELHKAVLGRDLTWEEMITAREKIAADKSLLKEAERLGK